MIPNFLRLPANPLATCVQVRYNRSRRAFLYLRRIVFMSQLRKTLGDIHSETCSRLMRLIETQSKKTLARWGHRLRRGALPSNLPGCLPGTGTGGCQLPGWCGSRKTGGTVQGSDTGSGSVGAWLLWPGRTGSRPRRGCGVCRCTDSLQCTGISLLWCCGCGVCPGRSGQKPGGIRRHGGRGAVPGV